MINPARYAQNYDGAVNGIAAAPKHLWLGSVGPLISRVRRQIQDAPVKVFRSKFKRL